MLKARTRLHSGTPSAIPCGLLFVFLNGALRLHAGHLSSEYTATVCDGCAFLGVHRPITAGTSNDREFAQVAYHRWAAPWVLACSPSESINEVAKRSAARVRDIAS